MDIPSFPDITQHHLGTSRCRREGVSTLTVLGKNQQRAQEMLSIRTARLNRLAVYLLMKVCAAPQRFVHLVCLDFVALPAGAGARQENFRFDTAAARRSRSTT